MRGPRLAILIALTSLLVALPAAAEWIDLGDGAPPGAPQTEVLDSDDGGITFRVTFPGFDALEVDSPLGAFTHLSMPGTGVTTDLGAPLLPVLREHVVVPVDGTAQLTVVAAEVLETSLDELGIGAAPWPAQPPLPKVPGAREVTPFAYDEAAYETPGLPADDWAALGTSGEQRGRRFTTVEIRPLQLDPVSGEAQVLTSVELRVDLVGGDWDATEARIERYASPDFERLARRVFLDPHGADGKGVLPLPLGYLIIASDSLFDAMIPFAEMKTRLGYDVLMVRTSEVPGGSSKTSIQAFVEDTYHNAPVAPTFLLLVGDTGQIPEWTGDHSYSASDLYYSTMDGSGDWMPDLLVGRFSSSSEADITRMVTKTVDYSMWTLGSGDAWIKKATFMASTDNHWISEGTHDYCIDTWLGPDGFDATRRYYDDGASTGQVLGDINAGLSQLTYSGHGYEQGWSDGPPVDSGDVQGLGNAGTLPVVQSYACLTGAYDTSCFGEAWLKASNGAVAFWGSSTYSYWDEDDIMQRAVYDAMWGDGTYWIRGAFNDGLWAVNEAYGGGGMSRAYYEQFNLFGDPSLDLWTAAPAPLGVEHAETLEPGETVLTVTVSDAGSGAVLQDALVCAYLAGEVHEAGYTDASGAVTLPLPASLEDGDELEIHASRHNAIPWGGLALIQEPSGDDDTSGDDDAADDDDAGDDDGAKNDAPNLVAGDGCNCDTQSRAAGAVPMIMLLLGLGLLSLRRR